MNPDNPTDACSINLNWPKVIDAHVSYRYFRPSNIFSCTTPAREVTSVTEFPKQSTTSQDATVIVSGGEFMRQRGPQAPQWQCNQMFSPFWHFTGRYPQDRPPSRTNNFLRIS